MGCMVIPQGWSPALYLDPQLDWGKSELMQPYTASEEFYEQYRGPTKVQSAYMCITSSKKAMKGELPPDFEAGMQEPHCSKTTLI